jgi:hypothetical protein
MPLHDKLNADPADPRTPDSISTIHLRLYIRQRTFETKAAIRQVHSLLESLGGSYELQVLDVDEYRNLAMEDQVPFTPMLVRLNPAPILWISMPQQNHETLWRELSGHV